ncbi:caspase family protein [Micromonospora chokoriensis]
MEEDCIPGLILRKHTSVEALNSELVALGGKGKEEVEGHIPFTPILRKSIQESLREALRLGHNYIGPEHLFLATLRVSPTEERLGRLLDQLGLTQEGLRSETFQALGVEISASTTKSASGTLIEQRTIKKRAAPKRPPRTKSRSKPLTLEEIDLELSRIGSAKDLAIDEENWSQVKELRSRERELLIEWAKLIRDGKRQPLDASARGGAGKAASEVGRLPIREASSVILIGASRYDDDAFPDMPAVENNIADLSVLLGDARFGGFDPARITRFLNPSYSLARDVAEIAEESTDTLLVYYSGHGLVPSDGELYLSLPETKSGKEIYTAIQYDKIRRALLDSPAANKIVILDCCFSGRAIEWMADGDGLAKGQLEVAGTYVLTATSATKPAQVREGYRNSEFTGELVRVLRDGSGELGKYIRLADIYPSVSSVLRQRGLPVPQQRGTDTSSDLALTQNPAWEVFRDG